MADAAPFRGIRYNPAKINELAEVTTPPYDVISPAQQEAAYERHPNNVIRLILEKTKEGDTDADNRYTRSAAAFNGWQEEEVLIRDEKPSMYLTSTEFTVLGRKITRFGLIARIRLEPFEKGIILPHEKTFSRIKSDRLALMQHCHANFSPFLRFTPTRKVWTHS